tara:strand:+ start:435 stop:650 length:216 start_codon:yes stop_codon:yes gene_type:complete
MFSSPGRDGIGAEYAPPVNAAYRSVIHSVRNTSKDVNSIENGCAPLSTTDVRIYDTINPVIKYTHFITMDV